MECLLENLQQLCNSAELCCQLLFVASIWIRATDAVVITTIDGHSYDFNGHGEYMLLDVNNGSLQIQTRTDYAVEGKVDSTLFVAFVLKDTYHNDSIDILLNRKEKAVNVYLNDGSLWHTSNDCGPPIQTNGFTIVCIPHKNAMLIMTKQRLQGLSHITFIGGDYVSFTFDIRQHSVLPNTSGLAGSLINGSYVNRDGNAVGVNSTEYEVFNFSESWSVQTENDSLFNYKLTGGNFSFFNEHHTHPRFLEKLVDNLSELFKDYTKENITTFNTTCLSDWDSLPNAECLLAIARTGDVKYGQAVMDEARRIHLDYELLHNNPPKYLPIMPANITAVYKDDAFWSIDLKEYVVDEDDPDQLLFFVKTNIRQFALENGVFNWTVDEQLRSMDTKLSFIVTDHLNFSTVHDVIIYYCGCDVPSECNFTKLSMRSSDSVKLATCMCPSSHVSGEFCENKTNPCTIKQCYGNITCDEHSLAENPCGPCPVGMRNEMESNIQNCIGQTIHVEDTISISCDDYGWDISIDMITMRQLYPVVSAADIYLGETACTGVESGGILKCTHGLEECQTLQTVNDDALAYRNELVYVVHDRSLPTFISRYHWRVSVECDVLRNESSINHFHHIDGVGLHVTGTGVYDMNMTFYRDSTFMQQILGNPVDVPVGSKVYVKVATMVADWSVKMWVHTCYTKPSPTAPEQRKYTIIQNGCEVDSKTHIISQSAHETMIVFEDFEYTSNREDIYVFCDATFCGSSDYSAMCVQRCNPVIRRLA